MAVLPHAFVVMPFGSKPGTDGSTIHFNRIYDDLILPALMDAALEPFRADKEARAGDIRADMFQELLLADLVVADLSIDNPNVWYELGVRHALRARGVVLICGGKGTTAFDLYTDRKLRYSLIDGAPDPATLADDRGNLTAMVKETMQSWHGRKISPVYNLLPNLQEPDWTSLRVGDVLEFWERHQAWENRIERARRASHLGDMMMLAEEAPVAAFRAKGWFAAGKALRRAGCFRIALETLEHGLEIEPDNLKALQEKGICLERLALAKAQGFTLDQAREHFRDVLEHFPSDAETASLAGRVEKDTWIGAWRGDGANTPEQMRADASDEVERLRLAIEHYLSGFRSDPSHYYSGINALTLLHLARHLTNDSSNDHTMEVMGGAIRFAAECETKSDDLYWALATLGDLEVLVGSEETTRRAYKKAIAKNDADWFALDSGRAQLLLLQQLGFRPEVVAAGIATFDQALQRLPKPSDQSPPRLAILFSGHMIDTPDRPIPRFPPEKEQAAATAIAKSLDSLGAGSQDVAFSQAASGGDLLFLEACQERGVRCQVLLPFDEPAFIERSIQASMHGNSWRDRYYAMKEKLNEPPRILPEELGPTPTTANSYERCNLWLLNSALACGIDRVRFVALWNGDKGDGLGGTFHMYEEVKRRTGRVDWIDTQSLT